MKKVIFVILLIFVAIIACFCMNYKEAVKTQSQAIKFNSEFEFYNRESVFGTDVTTIINKAINNNEKYNVPKDEQKQYIADDEYSIKIYVYMMINQTTYPMEMLNDRGLKEFTQYFGEVEFKCTDVKYHEKNGKIAEMTFAATQE